LEAPEFVGQLFVVVLEHYITLSQSSDADPARAMAIASTLMALSERCSDILASQSKDISSLLVNLLDHHDDELVVMALNILAIVALAPETKLDSSIQSALERLATSHPTPAVRSAAFDTLETIVVPSSTKPTTLDHHDETSVDGAMKELNDPTPAVRAYGMKCLKDLILQRHADISTRFDAVLAALMRHLDDEDSFIYLNAIRGLSAFTDTYADRTLPVLMAVFGDTDKDLGTRACIGEVLLQTVQRWDTAFAKHGTVPCRVLIL
jgi:hypothetical protein